VGVAVDNAVSLKWVKFDGALVGVSIKLQTIGYTTFCSFVVFIYLFIYLFIMNKQITTNA